VRGRSEQERGRGNARPGGKARGKGSEAEWRGKGFTLPSPAIYRSRGATLPRTPHTVRINCRRRRLPLTDGPTVLNLPDARACVIITARQPKGRGASSRGPPPPTSSTTPA
jgi:hypothetical protein